MAITAPTDVAGCRLWLQGNLGLYDATSGGSAVSSDAAAVKRWEDQSGSGMHFTEGTNPPARRNSGVNGAVSLRFDGSNDLLSLAHASAGALNTLQSGSYTLLWVMSPTSSPTNACWFSKQDAAATQRLFFLYHGQNGNTAGYLNRYDAFRGYPPDGKPVYEGGAYVVTYTLSLTGTNTGTETWRVNGQPVARVTQGVGAVDTAAPWRIGCGSNAGPNFFFPGDIALVLAYDSALSGTNLTDVEGYAAAYAGLTLASRESGLVIVPDGDSITFGQGSGSTYPNYPARMLTALGRSVRTVNAAIPGSVISTSPSANVTRSALEATNVLLVFSGTNGVEFNGETGATMYAKLQSYCTAARATFQKIVVFTMLPRQSFDATKEGYRGAFNTAIRSGFSGLTLDCDAVVDVAADARIGDDADADDAAKYADGTHPTAATYVIIGDLAAAQVGPLLPALGGAGTLPLAGGGLIHGGLVHGGLVGC